MNTRIDWLSFTLTIRPSINDHEAMYVAIEQAIEDVFGVGQTATIFGGRWTKNEHGRAPYSHSWTLRDSGCTLFCNPTLTHMTVEFSGQGCTRLIEQSMMDEVLNNVADRVTRIDVATDITTNTTPEEFIAAGHSERFGSVGMFHSPTGTTAYIGSMKSERFARVYRYVEPHPRAHLLRVECVSRRDHAKAVARAILTQGERSVAATLGDVYGWRHNDWQPDAPADADLSIVRAEKAAGGTVFWLIKQAAPAFKRLVQEGTIMDAESFLQHYFLNDSDDAAESGTIN